jgi:hypothetical protein
MNMMSVLPLMLMIFLCLTHVLIRGRIIFSREGMMWTILETPTRTHYMFQWSNDSVQDEDIERGIGCIGFEGFDQVRFEKPIRVLKGGPSTSYPCARGA